jgi:hypothetical protein
MQLTVERSGKSKDIRRGDWMMDSSKDARPSPRKSEDLFNIFGISM